MKIKIKSGQTGTIAFCVFHYFFANGLTEAVCSGISFSQNMCGRRSGWNRFRCCLGVWHGSRVGLDGTGLGSADVGATGVDGMDRPPADHRLCLQRSSVGSCWSVVGGDIIWLLPWPIHSLQKPAPLPAGYSVSFDGSSVAHYQILVEGPLSCHCSVNSISSSCHPVCRTLRRGRLSRMLRRGRFVEG